MQPQSGTQFRLGKDHLDIIQHGDAIRIDDRDVQGVSTHILRAENWMESDAPRRAVSIEYRRDGGIRIATIEGALREREVDPLADYARRVSTRAADNSLNELVTQQTVERKGFSINDQGMLLTASGKTFCGGLFDVTAIDGTSGCTFLWTADNPQPAAVLRMDDPNALTLAKLLPRLIQENDDDSDSGLRHLIGRIDCDSIGGTRRKAAHGVLLLVAMASGLGAAMLTSGAMNANLAQVLISSLPFAVVIVLVLIALCWYFLARATLQLGVFRRGLVIRAGDTISEIYWNDLQAMTLTDREINIGDCDLPNYVRVHTLHLRTIDEFPFGKETTFSWQESDATLNCTEYLRDKAWTLASRRSAAWPAKAREDSEQELATVS